MIRGRKTKRLAPSYEQAEGQTPDGRTGRDSRRYGGVARRPQHWNLLGIIEQARNVYELEIKPEKEARLGEEIETFSEPKA